MKHFNDSKVIDNKMIRLYKMKAKLKYWQLKLSITMGSFRLQGALKKKKTETKKFYIDTHFCRSPFFMKS